VEISSESFAFEPPPAAVLMTEFDTLLQHQAALFEGLNAR
jgi:hypothetical protein